MTAEKGTYLVTAVLGRTRLIEVGRRGKVRFIPGSYVYVGSALGPGGIDARLRRHVRGATTRHWHFDYFRPAVRVLGAHIRTDGTLVECRWADWLLDEAFDPVEGFGCTDCRCRSHLFRIGGPESFGSFSDRVVGVLGAEWYSVEDLERRWAGR